MTKCGGTPFGMTKCGGTPFGMVFSVCIGFRMALRLRNACHSPRSHVIPSAARNLSALEPGCYIRFFTSRRSVQNDKLWRRYVQNDRLWRRYVQVDKLRGRSVRYDKMRGRSVRYDKMRGRSVRYDKMRGHSVRYGIFCVHRVQGGVEASVRMSFSPLACHSERSEESERCLYRFFTSFRMTNLEGATFRMRW